MPPLPYFAGTPRVPLGAPTNCEVVQAMAPRATRFSELYSRAEVGQVSLACMYTNANVVDAVLSDGEVVRAPMAVNASHLRESLRSVLLRAGSTVSQEINDAAFERSLSAACNVSMVVTGTIVLLLYAVSR
jgi:hypothetical protein